MQANVSRFGYVPIRSLTFVITSADGKAAVVNAELKHDGVAVANVKGLEPLTEYTVIAYATNQVGRSLNSTTATFMTRKFL